MGKRCLKVVEGNGKAEAGRHHRDFAVGSPAAEVGHKGVEEEAFACTPD